MRAVLIVLEGTADCFGEGGRSSAAPQTNSELICITAPVGECQTPRVRHLGTEDDVGGAGWLGHHNEQLRCVNFGGIIKTDREEDVGGVAQIMCLSMSHRLKCGHLRRPEGACSRHHVDANNCEGTYVGQHRYSIVYLLFDIGHVRIRTAEQRSVYESIYQHRLEESRHFFTGILAVFQLCHLSKSTSKDTCFDRGEWLHVPQA